MSTSKKSAGTASKTTTTKSGKTAPKSGPKTAQPISEATMTSSSARESMKLSKLSKLSNKSGSASADSQKKKAMNRNEYETVDKEGAKSGRASVAVNRNIYEAVGPSGEDGGQSRKPGAGGDYVLVGGGAEGGGMATEMAADGGMDEPSSKSNKERRRLRRQKQMEEERMLMGQKRMIIVGCSVLIGLILIVAALIAGAFLLSIDHQPKASVAKVKPLSGNITHAIYGTAKCTDHFSKNHYDSRSESLEDSSVPDIIKHCVTVLGSAGKADLSCKELECSLNLFDAFVQGQSRQLVSFETGEIAHVLKPQAAKKTHYEPVNDTVFCRDYHHRAREVNLVCFKGECNYLYVGNGTPYGLEYEHGSWMDNCDEVMPCWSDDDYDTMTTIVKADTFKRASCNNASESRCRPGMAAIVYLQQMGCYMNPDRATRFCEHAENGMFRLFKCADCPDEDWRYNTTEEDYGQWTDERNKKLCSHKNMTYDSSPDDHTNPCLLECLDDGQSKTFVLPDGASCGHRLIFVTEEEQETKFQHHAHCVLGHCFWLAGTDNEANKIINYDTATCIQERKEREKEKPKFE